MWWAIVLIALAMLLGFWRKSKAMGHGYLQGKLVVVTGGGSGIGRAIALRFARAKASVCVWDLPSQQAGMDETVALVRKEGGVCTAFPVDVTNVAMVKEIVARIEQASNGIHVLINNAGVAYKKGVLDMTDDECERTLRVNTLAPIHTIRAVLPLMQKRKGGHLVVISSVMDSLATSNLSVYTASKWGVTGFTECLRDELRLANSPVTVTLVRPWIVATPMFQDASFFQHWIRALLPETTTAKVAEETFRAVIEGKAAVTVPPTLRVVGLLYQLLPRSVGAWINDLLGASELCKSK